MSVVARSRLFSAISGWLNWAKTPDLQIFLFAGVLLTALGLTATYLVVTGTGTGSLWVVAALAVVAMVAEGQSVRLTPGTEASISFLPCVLAAVVLGPLAAMIVGAASLLPDLARHDVERPYLRWVVWTASRALVGGAGGVAAMLLMGPATRSFFTFLAAATLASFVVAVVDFLLSAATLVLRSVQTWQETLRAVGPLLFLVVPFYAPVVAVLASAYRMSAPWTFVLFVIPGLAAHRLLVLYRSQRVALGELKEAHDALEGAGLSFAAALVATLDARDHYTAGHSTAVAIYARDIAERMQLLSDEEQLAYLAGLVHDIGKVGLPAGLLEKPGKLTYHERLQMQEHPAVGERILREVESYAEIARVVRHHHERMDGEGYPDRIAGSEIPLVSRILAVADSYNAMTSDRPYRPALPSRVARTRLADAVNGQLDATVVAAFESILAGADEGYRTARFENLSETERVNLRGHLTASG